MAINITQFAPPGKVSTLVWDKDMEAGAGKIFKGDLTGNVTGDLTGNVRGYINAPFTVSETEGFFTLGPLFEATMQVNPTAGIFTAVVVDGLQAKIASKLGTPVYGIINPSACTFPFDFKVEFTMLNTNSNIMTVSAKDIDGNVLQTWDTGEAANAGDVVCAIPAGTDKIEATMTNSVPQTKVQITSPLYYAYIDADTSIPPGMVPPPTNGVFTGDVVGNVTGNVTGNLSGDVITTYRMTPKTPHSYVSFQSGSTSSDGGVYVSRDNMVLYNVLPNQLLTGSINAYYVAGTGAKLRFLDKTWNILSEVGLTKGVETATNYTIPAGTNCIILTLSGAYQSATAARIARFDIEVV